ncbi:MAG: response regulator [Lachnospiraceae bacterium]|nr:response regulator [Lachnospiraceae bacterium]
MKYRILLLGGNNVVIDDFFLTMYGQYEIMTTSMRTHDIISHLKYFKPDALIYCINLNSYKDYNSIYILKEKLEQNQIPLVLIGSDEECEEFKKVTLNAADLILMKPLTSKMIMKKLNDFIAEWQENHAEPEEEVLSEPNTEEEITERKRILIIDDDPLMLKLVNEQLRDYYDVATAISGKIALKFLENKKTDLILLDYEMPVDNGPAVLRKIRENETLAKIPVVFLTGVSEREKIQEVLLMKPQGYLLKPINFDKLLSLIRGLINA